MTTDPQHYQELLDAKVQRLTRLMADLDAPGAQIFSSTPEHYRLRAEFRVWHEDDDSFYIMFEPGQSSRRYRVDQFAPGAMLINRLMTQLRERFMADDVLRNRLYQVEFLTTLSGEALITMIYRRPLDEAWVQAASELETALGARIIGRSRKQRIVLSEDFITERIEVNGRLLSYRQPEGSFVQPNGEMNCRMLDWARQNSPEDGTDLVELYCGLGNFTVALAPLFRRVLATEINKTAIAAAEHNMQQNGIDNVFVARLSAAEASQALERQRPFRRLQGFDLDDFRPDTLLVDPPRAGLDDETRAFAAGFRRIIYISCNPETLHRDLLALSGRYRVRQLALFDQFPMTPHIESGVLLEKED